MFICMSLSSVTGSFENLLSTWNEPENPLYSLAFCCIIRQSNHVGEEINIATVRQPAPYFSKILQKVVKQYVLFPIEISRWQG